MNRPDATRIDDRADRAPGQTDGAGGGIATYVYGLLLAGVLTAATFAVGMLHGAIWPPAVPAALVALGIAQIGVHLVFFLHVTTGPDNTNNVLALAFGVVIVALLVIGSLWIMHHLDHAMLPMPGGHDMGG